MRGILTLEYSIDADWALETGTWNAIALTDVLMDGTTIAEPEGFTTEMVNNLESQDGIRWNGTIRVSLGTSLPAENVAFHLRVTPHVGDIKWYGGVNGARGKVLETGLRSLSTGRPYADLVYQFVGANNAGAVKIPA